MGPTLSDERSIFLNALEITAAAERRAYLDSACDEPTLRARVDALLREHDKPQPLLDGGDVAPTIAAPTPAQQPGGQIGPYKLREQLGEGGFGVVYVAEQTEPVRRKVALKIIKPGMDTRDVIARFEAERQALALMDHPNIARVLDAGTTGELPNADCGLRIPPTDAACGLADNPQSEIRNPQSGRPYFVMELVRGVPITEFCDEQKLPTRERLQLFVDVCRAVQHAHHKGIIHRDLKPSNVMVTLHDGVPVPKVIDFGISKAISQQLTDKTIYTAYGQMVGTPLYMSPEQAEMSGLDVDTRSDVYSLGVLLYQLLTGTTPFDKETLKQAGFDEMRRIIREDDPPRPSARVSTLKAEDLSTVSDRRKIEPRKLGHSLRGELDWIAMKALEKDRNRRYESASALAADVERYLADETVQACPPSLGYRARKLLRRHRVALTVSAGMALSLLAGAAIATWQAIEAGRSANRARIEAQNAETAREGERKQRRRAEANLRAAQDVVEIMLTRVSGWMTHLPRTARVRRELLKQALKHYQTFVDNNPSQPETRVDLARAFQRIGDINRDLGRTQAARKAYARAVGEWTDIVNSGSDNPEHQLGLSTASAGLAGVLTDVGDRKQAEETYNRALAIQRRLARQRPETRYQLAETCSQLAVFLQGTSRSRQRKALLEEAVEIRKSLAKQKPDDANSQSDLGAALSNLAMVFLDEGRGKRAAELLNEAVRHQKQALEIVPDNSTFLKFLSNHHRLLADAHQLTGSPRDAESELQRAVELARKLARRFPGIPEYRALIASNSNRLGILLVKQGETAKARRAFESAAGLWEQLCDDHPHIHQYAKQRLDTLNNLAVVLMNSGRLAEAETVFRRELDFWDKAPAVLREMPKSLHSQGGTLNNLGMVLRFRREFEESRRVLLRAVAVQKKALKADPDNVNYRAYLSRHHFNLGLALEQLGEPANALKSFRETIRLNPRNADAYNEAAWLLANAADVKLRDAAQAVRYARSAVILDARNAAYQDTLGVALYRAGRWRESLRAMQKVIDLKGGRREGQQLFVMAMARRRLGENEEARRLYRESIAWMTGRKQIDPILRTYRAEARQLLGLHAPVAAVKPTRAP